MDLAFKLIDAAVDAGADAVKFQSFCADRLATVSASKAGYQKKTTEAGESQFDMLRRLELTPENHTRLLYYCAERGIIFLSTPFDTSSADLLVKLGLDCLKIPSGEIVNLPYLRHVGRLGRSIILSTGMASLDEVKEALSILNNAGSPPSRVALLHCTTQYPTPSGESNLRVIPNLIKQFPTSVIGFSDHTDGISCAIAAVALGAKIVEKHFTLNTSMVGPDHKASLEPAQLTTMISGIREVEKALGDGLKKTAHCETDNINIVRRYLVAARAISAGEPFTVENITTKRTGKGGVSPMRWDDMLMSRATRDYVADEPLEEL